ncbi:chitinase [Metarhizium album ARSEF 1941]|uniref:chitinase n=1 Tax=Metarhizium album (strain ARSEF 1941) TaxID=1081103 RepID=A0A0B2X0Z7_METAS|nr:chitinase [Metarhizium album ARSEF 1941]KHN99317.1 chitinase [Metarhizium album ARSEF 1941]
MPDRVQKTIILSLGGMNYSQGGWVDAQDAEKAAQSVWDMFGPVPPGGNVDRPFGSAVVDGFDFDFESTANNLEAFGAKLRSLMDRAGRRRFYLTASPQCVFPDAAMAPTLHNAAFDFVMVQFYNNWCSVSNFQIGSATQNAFNFDDWPWWARRSQNPKVKVFLGVLANKGAGAGFIHGEKLKVAIAYSKKFSSFGGVMMWDMSQLYANKRFLAEVVNALAKWVLICKLPRLGDWRDAWTLYKRQPVLGYVTKWFLPSRHLVYMFSTTVLTWDKAH